MLSYSIQRYCILSLVMVCIYLTGISALEATEYQKLKAVYLDNLIQYVTWPEEDTDSQRTIICILEDEEFKDILDYISEKNKTMKPVYISSFVEMTKCNILFIGESSTKYITEIFKITEYLPILVVSDIENIVQNGGTVEINAIKNRINTKINLQSLRKTGLTVSSKLLELSSVIQK